MNGCIGQNYLLLLCYEDWVDKSVSLVTYVQRLTKTHQDTQDLREHRGTQQHSQPAKQRETVSVKYMI